MELHKTDLHVIMCLKQFTEPFMLEIYAWKRIP